MFRFLLTTCRLLKKLLQYDDARVKDFDLVLHGSSVLEMQLSEESLERSVEMNLILGIDTGDGCQHSFEGNECFGWPHCESDCKCSTPKDPVDSTSLFS